MIYVFAGRKVSGTTSFPPFVVITKTLLMPERALREGGRGARIHCATYGPRAHSRTFVARCMRST